MWEFRESNWERHNSRQRELMSKCMEVKMGRKSKAVEGTDVSAVKVVELTALNTGEISRPSF